MKLVFSRYEKRLEKVRENLLMNAKNRKLILDFLADCAIGKTIKNSAKKEIGPSRLNKLLTYLLKFDKWIGKGFDVVNDDDMKLFIMKLKNNAICRENGLPYSNETKTDIKKIIRKFYKWNNGGHTYPDLVSWIDTFVEEKEVEALTREQIERLADMCNLDHKTVILMLFDGGFRISEFLSINHEDVTIKEDTVYLRVKHGTSKTTGRTISINLYSNILKNYIGLSNKQGRLFPYSEAGIRKMLNRMGKKVLGRSVYPHLFRHSSATYYANHISHAQLCKRYGWAFSSKMPQRYIDRSGIEEEIITQTIKADEMNKYRRENERLREELAMQKQSVKEIDLKVNGLTEKVETNEIKKYRYAPNIGHINSNE
ncbi:MAG: site-specific integrase [archaeon]